MTPDKIYMVVISVLVCFACFMGGVLVGGTIK